MKIRIFFSKLVAIVVIGGFFCSSSLNGVVASDYMSDSQLRECIQEHIPESVRIYAESQYMDYVMCAYNHADEYGLPDNIDVSIIQLGDPYVIFYPEYEKQSAVVSYPITYNDTTILTLDVCMDDGEWSVIAGDDNVRFFNRINYPEDYYIFYVTDNTLIAQNYDGMVACNDGEYEDALSGYTISQKIQIICELIENFNITADICDVAEKDADTSSNGVQMLSDYDVYETDNIELKLYNPQAQMSYNMCWAAAAATTINYIKTSSVTAFQVCNKCSIGYDEGAYNMYDIKYALSLYNINYSHIYTNQVASWEQVKKSVKDKYPMIIAGQLSTTELGHAVTIYGYDNSDGDKKVLYWNPAGNSGGGSRMIFKYSTYRFSTGGVVYDWKQTLYK